MRPKLNSILEGKGKEIYQIFLNGWHSIREASDAYNHEFMAELEKQGNPGKSKSGFKHRSHPTVTYYFYKFKDKGWINTDIINKTVPRLSKNKKEHEYTIRYKAFRANLNPFFEKVDIKFSKNEKKILEFIFWSAECQDLRDKIFEEGEVINGIKKTLLYIASASLNYDPKQDSFLHQRNFKKENFKHIEMFSKMDELYLPQIDEDPYYWLRFELEENKWEKAQEAINKINDRILIYSIPYTLIIKIFKLTLPPELGIRVLNDRMVTFDYDPANNVFKKIINEYKDYTGLKIIPKSKYLHINPP